MQGKFRRGDIVEQPTGALCIVVDPEAMESFMKSIVLTPGNDPHMATYVGEEYFLLHSYSTVVGHAEGIE